MKVLVIVGECIQVNTSSNLCNLAYLRGLVELGCEVTLLSADKHGYETDPALKIPDGVKCYTYRSMTLYEKLSMVKKHTSAVAETNANAVHSVSRPKKKRLLHSLKKRVFALYGPYGVYVKFAYRAARFRSNETYDLVVSLSNPASSHLLAHKLLERGRVKSRHWVQIWEDPWYSDVDKGPKTQAIFTEEKRILSVADRVCYVSPITLGYQKKLYPESAAKMMWAPLPAYYEEIKTECIDSTTEMQFGYFGEYYLPSRNIRPFYEAVRKTGVSVSICGNSNVQLGATDQIHVYPRLNLNDLRPIEQRTDVLVFLCNCKGGQIPGKIYQYAATNKTILFILDGTDEEKKILRDYFEPFNRFVFCENTPEDIEHCIRSIVSGEIENINNHPLTAFRPKEIIKGIIEKVMQQ